MWMTKVRVGEYSRLFPRIFSCLLWIDTTVGKQVPCCLAITVYTLFELHCICEYDRTITVMVLVDSWHQHAAGYHHLSHIMRKPVYACEQQSAHQPKHPRSPGRQVFS